MGWCAHLSIDELGAVGRDDIAALGPVGVAIHGVRRYRLSQSRSGRAGRVAPGGESHAGIVYAPQHTSVSALIQGLVLIHRVLDAEEMAGHIEFL
jgi:hypothetical protein